VTAYLRVSVFLSGFGVLGAEMVAPRLLAPAFGTSQLVWTNVIGTILAALTLGSWLGGRLADRRPSERGFAWILLAGGLLVAAVPLATGPLLASAVQALGEQRVGGYLASLAASSLLFAPPVLVLATVAPYAVRLGAWGRADLGRVAGTLSALGALGSIAGTFITSLVLLPLLGSRATLLAIGALLAGAGALRALRPRGAAATGLALLLIAASVRGPLRPDPQQVFESESLYSYLQVKRDASGWTRLATNESLAFQSVWPAEGILTGSAWDALALAPAMAVRSEAELRVLIVGLAAGTVARQIHEAYAPSIAIHGIELDSAVVDVGRRFFGLDTVPNLTIETRDARVAVAALRGRFDVIVIDVFHGLYVPPHLVTREFFAACAERLAPAGVLAMNVATPLDSGRLLGAIGTTLESTFTHVRFTRLPSGQPVESTILYASAAPLEMPPPERLPELLRPARPTLHRIDVPERHRRVLTDDHAPIEWLTDRALVEAVWP
jgi:predicted membrane-bound spermidine synthase